MTTDILLVDRNGIGVAITNVGIPEPEPGPCKVCGAASHDPCEKCGEIVHVGDWGWCPHGRPTLVVVAHGEIYRKHLGSSVKGPRRFGSIREEERYLRDNNLVRLADVPVTEGERNAFERGRERTARMAEGRPDKITPLSESEVS